MAIFFPPPPVFTGGAQPYAPKPIPDALAALQVDNPPFGSPESVAISASVVAITQPTVWPYAFFGATQPYMPGRLPLAITSIAVNDPPFWGLDFYMEGIVVPELNQPDPWTYRFFGGSAPFVPKKNSPAIPGQSADPPPFSHRGLTPTTSEAIALTQPNPWTYNFAGALQPFAPRALPPSIIAIHVDNPPLDMRLSSQLAAQIAYSQPDPWTYSFMGGRAPFDARKITVSVTYLPPTVKIYVIN